jgi:hypothetical protein
MQRPLGTAAALAVALLVVGCATTRSPQAAALVEADEAMVAGCELVGTFNGTSGWGGSGATAVGANNAKNAVYKRAAAAGATHVVFTELTGGMFTKATGRGYRCEAGAGG